MKDVVVASFLLVAVGVLASIRVRPRRRKRPPPEKVCVGIAVVVVRESTPKAIVVGRRANAHGDGLVAVPGGWLERGESFEECALREAKEEIGLMAKDVVDVEAVPFVSNNVKPEFHSVSAFVRVRVRDDFIPSLEEPHKCAGWSYATPDDLEGQPLFPSLAAYVNTLS